VRDQLSTRRDRRTGATTHYVYDSFDMLVDPYGHIEVHPASQLEPGRASRS
jgi:hypothetical protein